ncbi:uncharacterized protein SAPINGB_P002419 [Magnusiomyces paraingens]|uniref:Coatomer subunit gamma n=1 Tax=Magnusiomyces paraingens TaxID=2606893 RepID=A0A5E8BE28_9ASCO|nr:uncharacterized protein SAPINGB_P002419 [Saprochaete ingens]VVT49739.1 unnamed protein product [Saprochaete ingens]
MSTLTYKKNDDIESGSLDKMTVFQECISGFNASPIQSKKCRTLLTKLVRLIHMGEVFPPEESTSLFFSITKLFQHKDPSLRQMVYVAIKELAPTANDVIMVTSSIMKDIQSSSDAIYKPNAIRALIHIIDSSTVQSIERLIRTAIADKQTSVSSAALVSTYHLTPIARDVVRKWANDVQEALQGSSSSSGFFGGSSNNGPTAYASSTMYQYHAIGLLYQLRSHDKMAVMRMIQQLTSPNSPVKNPNAIVMLLRLIGKIMEEDKGLVQSLLPIVVSYLTASSDMVVVEAVKIILQQRNPQADPDVLHKTLAIVRKLLAFPRNSTQFAVIRVLNRFALDFPVEASECNPELEPLISSSSRAIATYAITTLLKTGDESSVDRLMSKISGFMNEISDEFKIIVVDAIRNLALKFPQKHPRMLTFLSSGLRDEGGLEYKTAVVEALFDMIRCIPAAKEPALGHLSELVEDCEFAELSVRILHMLGSAGPSTSQPTKYIRYIYNRVVLENAVIRSAAVTALSKFAVVDDLKVRKSIKVLLTRCLDDVTDEVRDRAALALRFIELDEAEAKEYITPQTVFSPAQFERELTQYLSSSDKSVFLKPFDINTVPRVTLEQSRSIALEARNKALLGETGEKPKASAAGAESGDSSGEKLRVERELVQDKASEYAAALASIDAFKDHGPILKTSKPVSLTESGLEYVVKAVKHMFKNHIVIQYEVTNTIEAVLEDVVVDIAGDFESDFVIPLKKLGHNETGTVYVSGQRPSEEFAIFSIENSLRFIYKEIDPSTGEPEDEGFEDVYSTEDLEFTVGDYLIPKYVGNFMHQWDELAGAEAVSTFQFGPEMSINNATELAINTLSLMPLESTDMPTSLASHQLKLFGETIDGSKVAVQVRMVYTSKNGSTLKVSVRSQDEQLSELVADAIGNV